MKKAFVGIDPGKTGAAALIYSDGQHVLDWPGDASIVVSTIRFWKDEYTIMLAALESVHAMPKQGVTSTFNFGCNLGQWIGVLSALEIPFIMPSPRKWKKGLIKKADGLDQKSASLAVARRLFPGADLKRKKDHGRADALLLAWWAKQQIQ